MVFLLIENLIKHVLTLKEGSNLQINSNVLSIIQTCVCRTFITNKDINFIIRTIERSSNISFKAFKFQRKLTILGYSR